MGIAWGGGGDALGNLIAAPTLLVQRTWDDQGTAHGISQRMALALSACFVFTFTASYGDPGIARLALRRALR
jgi:hypothetical protein